MEPNLEPKFQELTTRQVCELLSDLQKKGTDVIDHYKKYGALCYGLSEDQYLELPLSLSQVSFQHITSVIKMFS